MGAQAQDLVEREPFRAALGFGQALGQVGVLAQDAAEMGLGHGDQVAGDFPGGKPAQRLGAPFIEPAPHKISAPFCAGLRQILEARGAHGGPEILFGLVWIDSEIRGHVVLCLEACHLPMLLMSRVFVSITENVSHGTDLRT
jgi:hypothetical protein